jgi:hypothetical protein
MPAQGAPWARVPEGDFMRAETQAVVDDIKQSLALLRRHL